MAVLQAVLVLVVLTSHSGAYLLDGRNFTHVLEALSQESLGISDIQVHTFLQGKTQVLVVRHSGTVSRSGHPGLSKIILYLLILVTLLMEQAYIPIEKLIRKSKQSASTF